jgi:Ion channel
MAAMLHQVWVGCVLTFLTTVVHAGGMGLALRVLGRVRPEGRRLKSALGKASLVAELVLVMFLASILESTMWASTYLGVGAFASFEPALYFSMVTFTTLGYGDLVVTGDWRLFASFEAATGTIMFGWTTALIFAFVQRVYFAGKLEGEA